LPKESIHIAMAMAMVSGNGSFGSGKTSQKESTPYSNILGKAFQKESIPMAMDMVMVMVMVSGNGSFGTKKGRNTGGTRGKKIRRRHGRTG